MRFYFTNADHADKALERITRALGPTELHPYDETVYVAEKWQMKLSLRGYGNVFYIIDVYLKKDSTLVALLFSDLNFKIEK
jgi:hypothetical protein